MTVEESMVESLAAEHGLSEEDVQEVISNLRFDDLELKFHMNEPADVLPKRLQPQTDTIVVIDGLPCVDTKKEAKLMALLKKNIFAVAGASIVPNTAVMPRVDPNDESSISKGYLFVQLPDAKQAESVVSVANGYRLDKSHQLTAVCLSDFDRIRSTPDEMEPVKPEPFVQKEYLGSWLSDEAARDQFLTLFTNRSVSVHWNVRGMHQNVEGAHSRSNWTDSYVQWSPMGTYLVTVHAQGIMLWGGSSFGSLGRFPHPNVHCVSFSNTESMLVTYSPPKSNNMTAEERRAADPNLLVWDVASGRLLAGFVHLVAQEDLENQRQSLLEFDKFGFKHSSDGSLQPPASDSWWPVLKFSHDDRFAARVLDQNNLAIYHTNASEDGTFSLVDGKPLSVTDLRDFAWSPVDGSMVHWTRGSDDIPARVTLLGAPTDAMHHTRPVLRTKNLFNVLSCKVHWHNLGKYLCVLVERHAKKNRKQRVFNVELFRLSERGVPVESLEFKAEDETDGGPVSAFAWEPNGDRFIVASVIDFRTVVRLYTMAGTESAAHCSAVRLVETLERKSVRLTDFLWSPRGEFLLLVGRSEGGSNCSIEWIYCAPHVSSSSSSSVMSSLAQKEHYMGTDVAWDPSGRYVASWASAWSVGNDHSYQIFDLRGEQLTRVSASKLALLAWRPRPPTRLSFEQARDVRRRLKEYASRFEVQDLREMEQASSDSMQLKGRKIVLWNEWRRHCRRDYETRNARRKQILGRDEPAPWLLALVGSAAVDQNNQSSATIEHWIEDEVLEETEEPLDS